jgi:glycosyltransferase 2 family protein
MTTKAKPAMIFLLKLLVSGGLIVYFLTRIHIERFVDTLLSANFSFIAVALAIYLCAQAVSAVRWTVLVRPLGIGAPFKDIVCYQLIGMFFNLFAPGTVGGDISRVYYLVKHRESDHEARAVPIVRAAMSVLMDRAIGMVVLIWIGAAALLLFPSYPVPFSIRAVTFCLALGFVLAAALLPVLRRFLPDDGNSIFVKLRLALRSYQSHRSAIVMGVLLSLVVHLIQAWMHVVMGRALNLVIPFSFSLIVYPLVGTFAAIPISLNGIGLREGGYVLLLGLIGITTENGIAFGLLLFMIVALDSLIGGLVFLVKRSRKPEPIAAGNNF